MELKVYNWEYFERNKMWFLFFSIVIIVVIVVSILSKNILWWLLVLIFAWWYIYYITKSNEEIIMVIWKNSLQIWKTPYLWNTLNWFVLEYHIHEEKIHNMVIIYKDLARIYTIKDSQENLENFVNELSKNIPMLDKYEQSNFEKFLRKIKL